MVAKHHEFTAAAAAIEFAPMVIATFASYFLSSRLSRAVHRLSSENKCGPLMSITFLRCKWPRNGIILVFKKTKMTIQAGFLALLGKTFGSEFYTGNQTQNDYPVRALVISGVARIARPCLHLGGWVSNCRIGGVLLCGKNYRCWRACCAWLSLAFENWLVKSAGMLGQGCSDPV